MTPRFISTQTTLEPFGLVRITGYVQKDKDYDPETEGPAGSPFYISDLTVTTEKGETVQGWTRYLGGRRVYVCSLENWQVENCHDVLIDKYQDNEQARAEYLIDEAIERGREVAHYAYQ